MATSTPRVWFKSISLENVRSFGTKQTINFTDKDGNAARWNVILGDNGTGKTTVLKGLVLSILKKFRHDYYYQNVYESLYRSGSLETKVISEYEYVTDNDTSVRYASLVFTEGDDDEYYDYKGKFPATKINGMLINRVEPYEKMPFICAYGAARRMEEFSSVSNNSNNQLLIDTLLLEDDQLMDAEDWLIKAEYVSLKDDRNSTFTTVHNILTKLFRQEAIEIYTKVYLNNPAVFFKTHYGDVRLHELSLGYKTLIAWMVDFAKGLLDRYPDSENPLAEPAVCLVDELDLHLHPKFQRTIIKFLTETFENTQFIVTAHSPLIVVAAEERPLDANIILLKREGDQTVVVNDPVDVSKWSVDQILNSDLFGHVPSQSAPLTDLQTERNALLAKQKLTAKEKAHLAELEQQIGFVPFGRDQAEIKAETIIQQLADVLRTKQ